MTQLIEFIDTWGDIHPDYYPVPAVTELPDWYKKAESFHGGEAIVNRMAGTQDTTTGTIKRCKPVLDSLSAGYLLKLPVDVNVRLDDSGAHWFEWPSRTPIGFHNPNQAPGYPEQEQRKNKMPKFVNPWIIKTPPGYSTLFMSPVHRKLPFQTLEGIVDTDTFFSAVQLPFLFKDDKFEGLLEAGTPIAQVVPIKRDAWKMNARPANDSDRKAEMSVVSFLGSVFNGGYAKRYWSRKEYR